MEKDLQGTNEPKTKSNLGEAVKDGIGYIFKDSPSYPAPPLVQKALKGKGKGGPLRADKAHWEKGSNGAKSEVDPSAPEGGAPQVEVLKGKKATGKSSPRA